MCFSCPRAMRIPDALMNPEITGWLRKFARKPSRNTAMITSTAPDSIAKSMAAPTYSACNFTQEKKG